MTRIKSILLMLFCVGIFQSCGDVFERKHKIHGLYFVSDDPGNLSPTLYYDLGNGNAIGRVGDVKAVGHVNNLMIVETKEGFYFFNSQDDNEYLNSAEIIGELRTRGEFLRLIDSLKIQDFQFDYN